MEFGEAALAVFLGNLMFWTLVALIPDDLFSGRKKERKKKNGGEKSE